MRDPSLITDTEQVGQVEQFTYLGKEVSVSGGAEQEINFQIAKTMAKLWQS